MGRREYSALWHAPPPDIEQMAKSQRGGLCGSVSCHLLRGVGGEKVVEKPRGRRRRGVPKDGHQAHARAHAADQLGQQRPHRQRRQRLLELLLLAGLPPKGGRGKAGEHEGRRVAKDALLLAQVVGLLDGLPARNDEVGILT